MQPAPSAVMGAPMGAAVAEVPLTEVDEDLCCEAAYIQPTTRNVPATAQLRQHAGLTFGFVVHPLAELPELDPIPVVDFRDAGVIRCRQCRAYINPFAQFLDNGRRWMCNLCGQPNDVDHAYYSPTNEHGIRQDRDQRPELCGGSVEFVAPVEYMVRQPQPPVYMFVIDVSCNAVVTGMLATAAAAIKASLDELPSPERVQVGFLTFDRSVHFYKMAPDVEGQPTRPKMMVVTDLEEPFQPVPGDLLVNLNDCRKTVESFLDGLATMHQGTTCGDNCLGAALQAAFSIVEHVGGKMVVLQSGLPTCGPGKLRPREAPAMLGGAEEHKLLAPDPTDDGMFYRKRAMAFSRQQISVDTFFFSASYTDVASIAALSRFTAGQPHYYPAFAANMDGTQLHKDIVHDLTRTTGFEAVMRVRCSQGLRIENFYGCFFIRGQDLLVMPNVTCDTAFNIELVHTDMLRGGDTVSLQAALLYTNSEGERRICVHTTCLPVATILRDVFDGIEADALANMMAKRALDTALRVGLPSARAALHKSVVGLVKSYYQHAIQLGQQPKSAMAALPEHLQLLPLYAMGLQKSLLFRGGNDIKSDERATLVFRMLDMPITLSAPFMYPRLYALHQLKPGEGEELDLEAEEAAAAAQPEYESPPTAGFDQIRLPAALGLGQRHMSNDGVYLMEDGVEALIWVGSQASPQVLEQLLGVPSIAGIDTTRAPMPVLPNPLNQKTHAILAGLADTNRATPRIRVVRQGAGDWLERRFGFRLVEDKQNFSGGHLAYQDYLKLVNREAQGEPGPVGSLPAATPAPAAPAPAPAATGFPGMPMFQGGQQLPTQHPGGLNR